MKIKAGFENKYFLEKVYLSGYKSIRQTEIEFKNNLSIIIGKNGSGKTNFLEMLNKVLNDKMNGLREFLSALMFTGEKSVSIKIEKQIRELSFTQKQFIANDDIEFSGTIGSKDFFYTGNEYSNLIELYQKEDFVYSSTLIKHGVPTDYIIVDNPYTFSVTNQGLPSFMDSEFSPDNSFFINSLLTSFILRKDNFEWWMERKEEVDLDTFRKQLSEAFLSLELIKPFLQQFSPIKDVRLSKNYNLFEGTNQEKFKVSNLFVEFCVNGIWFPFSSLSTGTQRIFYVITEVTTPFTFFFREGWFGFTKNGYSRIILIEEPELGIHPHQLRKLMLFLKEQSKTKQIIITTHSPEVLDIVESDELDSIILSWYDKEKGTQLRHLTDKEKEKAQDYIKDDFLSDYWMHSNLEPAN